MKEGPLTAMDVIERATGEMKVHTMGYCVGGTLLATTLAWLADKLASAGTPLKRGMIVMTGSMVPIQFPAAGDHAIVEVEELGTAELVAP